MHIPSREEIKSCLDKLDEVVADELETAVLEFKPWLDNPKDNLRTAIEYTACFANYLGGVIVFGVKDRIRGRKNAITGCYRYDLDVFRRDIYQNTKPSISITIEELFEPEGVLLLLSVPRRPGDTPVGTSKGLYTVRVGKNCMPIDPIEWDRRQAASGLLDWSALPMEQVNRTDIDEVEIARMRRIIEVNKPQSKLLSLATDELLSALGIVRDGKITRAGFLIAGKAERLALLLPQHEVTYLHFKSVTDFDVRIDMKEPLLFVLERIVEAIEARNPFKTMKLGLFNIPIYSFPEQVYREALLNAIIHRNYLEPGTVYIRHYHDRMEISNPGGLVEGISILNFLHAEPRARNRLLSEVFQQLGLVERAGVGRMRLFIPSLQFGKPAPQIESDDHMFRITLINGSYDEPLARFIAHEQQQGKQFDLDDLLLITYLRKHGEIDVNAARTLLQRSEFVAREKLDSLSLLQNSWIEKRGKKKGVTYHLSRRASDFIGNKAAYTRSKGIDQLRWPELIRAYVMQHGSINNTECRELIGVGNSASARVQVSRLLNTLTFLSPYGTSSKSKRYRLREG